MIPFLLYGSMLFGSWILNIENVFSFENVSLSNVGQSLTQYIVGSFAFATISGMLVFAIALITMIVCKRKSCNE